ncbi:UDP-N-acetylmuramoyl-L-alanyl-D-glutamate--2,6-diaminopimelate ligase [bacterium]|nr:MAG: UDP-N-acetylmuramoyl-L-alanyl-D-glutamate--2,6-diaminopimelate ligase [bacterium]
MRLKDIISALKPGAQCVNWIDATDEIEITRVAYDSRAIERGNKGVIFAAIPGEHEDGSSFAKDAVSRGAVAVLARAAIEGLKVPQVIAEDVRGALAKTASLVYGEPSKKLRLAGVTGTNGKTTITYLLESIFNESGRASGVMGTISYRYAGKSMEAPHTTPEAPDLQSFLKEMTEHGVTHVVMEVSSHALYQKRAHGCKFDVAVFTNLTHEHLDYHKTMDEYYRCKAMLFKELLKDGAKAVINTDDAWGRRLNQEVAKPLSYGIRSNAEIHPKTFSLDGSGIKAVVATPAGDVSVNSLLAGEYNLQNIMAAIGAAVSLGCTPDEISKGITALKRVPGRLDKVECGAVGKNFIAFIDYAHTADALSRALGALRAIAKGRVITVFGCGGNRDRAKRPMMGEVSARLSDITIITSDNPRDEDPLEIIKEIEAGITGGERFEPWSSAAVLNGYTVIADRAEAVKKAVSLARDKDIILVAGKGHEDYQIVKGHKAHFSDFEALSHAINELSKE